jgi:hypothetical protein
MARYPTHLPWVSLAAWSGSGQAPWTPPPHPGHKHTHAWWGQQSDRSTPSPAQSADLHLSRHPSPAPAPPTTHIMKRFKELAHLKQNDVAGVCLLHGVVLGHHWSGWQRWRWHTHTRTRTRSCTRPSSGKACCPYGQRGLCQPEPKNEGCEGPTRCEAGGADTVVSAGCPCPADHRRKQSAPSAPPADLRRSLHDGQWREGVAEWPLFAVPCGVACARVDAGDVCKSAPITNRACALHTLCCCCAPGSLHAFLNTLGQLTTYNSTVHWARHTGRCEERSTGTATPSGQPYSAPR